MFAATVPKWLEQIKIKNENITTPQGNFMYFINIRIIYL
jgi:hypothetical protein